MQTVFTKLISSSLLSATCIKRLHCSLNINRRLKRLHSFIGAVQCNNATGQEDQSPNMLSVEQTRSLAKFTERLCPYSLVPDQFVSGWVGKAQICYAELARQQQQIWDHAEVPHLCHPPCQSRWAEQHANSHHSTGNRDCLCVHDNLLCSLHWLYWLVGTVHSESIQTSSFSTVCYVTALF